MEDCIFEHRVTSRTFKTGAVGIVCGCSATFWSSFESGYDEAFHSHAHHVAEVITNHVTV